MHLDSDLTSFCRTNYENRGYRVGLRDIINIHCLLTVALMVLTLEN